MMYLSAEFAENSMKFVAYKARYTKKKKKKKLSGNKINHDAMFSFSFLDEVLSVNNIIDWFGLVSWFNGISTFVGYLMPKPFSLKKSHGTI